MGIDLPLLWALIIGFGVMMYVIMDGFDLGIGILYPFLPDKHDRDVAMNTVAPVWDGNETWLVLGGAGLFAAFPMVYSVVLTALYLPLIFMLLGLIFRGIAFEFRFKAREHERPIWDKAFIGGSLAATFFQGVVLGAFINGLPMENGTYTGGAFDWFAPFPLFTGVGLVFAYALLGSTWLLMKTEGPLQDRMRRLTYPLTWVMLALITVISVWTPIAHPQIAERWFSFPNVFWFSPIPLLVVLCATLMLKGLQQGAQVSPFIYTLILIFLGYSGLAVSGWPHILPPDVTLWEAAAPPQSLGFTLVGALFIIPFILMYTALAYYVFRGKVRPEDGYH
ncbi:cytochrome d ubiquinol oxidase subunit II [Alloalcanivorax xenomutans]|uniref:Cytochrome d ubiquinol oxidase subunit II n=1 Tax=Alloalcanivorax xenomutans TaxID=1094342 RepID=A0A9Q3ZI87_9GAMM|nr:cytochrome d ubiquinol oxidase subunit II [Alloalcanivorax xenomutans]ERS12847.1 ubiquinol oxidase subunit II, cyanide insensitive [Alcanivorax sp. PN-3]KYZ86869.1 ubiquinol oxidase subunit II [Alcanivorax sp. KX64203]MBA4723025.1 cytochrome d ubiquinol oxidase subunit II [Alcanivorax sp.]ARB46552.1 ubiquinol oxidase subunit II [Alloalcanivorax xenomutans]MCE7510692.1 cytochrome d ubiquinol oxidase subunit II [Alloalcanivorax xenomutans]